MTDENQEFEIDYTSEAEYLNALCNVLDVIDKVDTMTKEADNQKKRIIRKSLAVMDKIIGNIYDGYFEGDE